MKRPNILKRIFGRIARAVLWCVGFNVHKRLTYRCDGCGRVERERAQPVALDDCVLLFCPACVKNGKVEKARKVQKARGLGVLTRHPEFLQKRGQAMNKTFSKAYGERG